MMQNLAQHGQSCTGVCAWHSPVKHASSCRPRHVAQCALAASQIEAPSRHQATPSSSTKSSRDSQHGPPTPKDLKQLHVLSEAISEPMARYIARILDDKLLGPEPKGHSEAIPSQTSLHRYNPQSSSSDDADESDTETCITAHPGSVCCTTTVVEREPTNKTVVILLKTTVRLTSPTAGSVSMSDLEQLGLIAGAQQLQAAASALAAGTASQSIQARHDAVLSVLAHGRVVSAEKFTNQFGHVTFRCVLEDERTKQRMHAMVKPTIEGHCHGWHRAEIEAVAYRMNRLLGMDYVPPCAYRKEMDVDWQHYEHGGTFMYWAEEGRELRTQPMEQWGLKPEVLLSDTRILDVLIQNSDRHHGHFLIAEHWAHGTGASSPARAGWRGTPLPVLIDHAAGFRAEAFVDMRHDNAFNTGETNRVSARTFLRLRCLDRAVVADALNDLLTPAEIDQVMKRRDEILQYFDHLVDERGYERVVIEA